MAPNPDLLAVEVHKRRREVHDRWLPGGADRCQHRAGSTRTIAIESEDATRVIATVREVGLAPRPNVSFVRGLKALVGFGIERFAVIDVGTNSVKFHIAERGVDGGWRTIVDHAQVTRLGDGLQKTGRLNPEPMSRTVEAIAVMAEEARRHRVAAIAAVGTAGLRIAPEQRGLRRRRAGALWCLRRDHLRGGRGSVRVPRGDGGPRWRRVAGRLRHRRRSSQFTFGHGDRVDERFSVEVGAVRFTEQYGLDDVVTEDVLSAALAAIEADLVRLDGRAAPEVLVGLGGAVTNLAGVKHGLAEYDPDIVQGTVLDRAEIDRQIELYRTRSARRAS